MPQKQSVASLDLRHACHAEAIRVEVHVFPVCARAFPKNQSPVAVGLSGHFILQHKRNDASCTPGGGPASLESQKHHTLPPSAGRTPDLQNKAEPAPSPRLVFFLNASIMH